MEGIAHSKTRALSKSEKDKWKDCFYHPSLSDLSADKKDEIERKCNCILHPDLPEFLEEHTKLWKSSRFWHSPSLDVSWYPCYTPTNKRGFTIWRCRGNAGRWGDIPSQILARGYYAILGVCLRTWLTKRSQASRSDCENLGYKHYLWHRISSKSSCRQNLQVFPQAQVSWWALVVVWMLPRVWIIPRVVLKQEKSVISSFLHACPLLMSSQTKQILSPGHLYIVCPVKLPKSSSLLQQVQSLDG